MLCLGWFLSSLKADGKQKAFKSKRPFDGACVFAERRADGGTDPPIFKISFSLLKEGVTLAFQL